MVVTSGKGAADSVSANQTAHLGLPGPLKPRTCGPSVASLQGLGTERHVAHRAPQGPSGPCPGLIDSVI